jgi:hypothetical protein
VGDSFKFEKRCQLFIRAHNETFSVAAMRISNPDRSPLRPTVPTRPQRQAALIAGWQMIPSLYRRRFLHTVRVGWRQSIDQFHEAGVVKITNGGLATWLYPFWMLAPQVVMNLLPKLGIGVDLVRHGYVKDSRMSRECSSNANARREPSERARKARTQLAAVCTTLGQLIHFVVLALQQHGQQSALGKGRS